MSGHEITHLLHEYGLAVVFAAAGLQALGAPVPGTTVLIAAAVYAATSHGLPIIGVIAAGTLGVLAGTSAGFAIGRRRGAALLRWIARRLGREPTRAELLRREFAAHGGRWIVIGRFITGVRNVTGLLAGSTGMSWRQFIAYSSAAALAWSSLNALEYYLFGRALAGADTWVQVVLVIAGLSWLAFSLRLLRRQALRRLGEFPGAE